MSRLSVALRIARRSSARSLGRSALIVGMIAIPVTGMTAAAVVATATIPNTQDTITTKLGHMEGLGQVMGSADSPVEQPPTRPQEAGYLPGSAIETGTPADYTRAEAFGDRRVIEIYPTSLAATTATGYASFDALEGPVWMPQFAGRFDVTAGRGPEADNEVMVTEATLARLGVSLGDAVTLRNGLRDAVTVVGIIDDAQLADTAQQFYARPGTFASREAGGRLTASTYYFTEPTSWADIRALNARGVIVLSRQVLLDPPVGDDIPPTRGDDVPVSTFAIAGIIGVFAAFEVILLAGAAFTVTARQQQRTLATIASVGAPPSVLRSVVTASGLVLGLVGGLVGGALGIGGGALFMQLTLDGSATQYYGFRVPWLLIAAVIAFAVLVGWVAALLPARTAAKLDVVAALRGSRRPPAPNRKAPIAGLVLLVVGTAAAIVGGALLAVQTSARDGVWSANTTNWIPGAILGVGPVVSILGIILCGPLVLRFSARVLGRGSLGARLASRDAARNPGRSVPAVAVTLTTIFIAVAAMNIAASTEAFQSSNYFYSAVPGSVEVPLNNDYAGLEGPIEEYGNVDQLETAVRDSVDVDELALMASVRDGNFWEPPAEEEATVLYPKFAVPEVNACPDDADRSDARCQERSFAAPGDSGIRDKIWVGDEKQLALILGHDPSVAARDMLADGGVISFYGYPVADGELTLNWWTGTQVFEGADYSGGSAPARTETLKGIVEKPDVPVYFGYFMSPQTADSLGLEYRDTLILASTKVMPTEAEQDAFAAAVSAARGGVSDTEVVGSVSLPPVPYATALSWGLLGLSALIALAAASVAIGLARFDGRQDDATLASLGAPRTARRSFAFWQAIVLTGIGSVVGAALGFALSLAMSQTVVLPFAPPLLQVALISVGLPLLIGAGAWVTAARAPWVLRVAGD